MPIVNWFFVVLLILGALAFAFLGVFLFMYSTAGASAILFGIGSLLTSIASILGAVYLIKYTLNPPPSNG